MLLSFGVQNVTWLTHVSFSFSCQDLVISFNFLTGDLPAEVSNLRIDNILATDNRFTGECSSRSIKIVICVQFSYFGLLDVVFAIGQIPDEITKLWGLKTLKLDNNCKYIFGVLGVLLEVQCSCS